MKKQSRNLISLTALVAVFCIGYATVSSGAPAHNIRFTKHNLGAAGLFGGFRAISDTEICIFCHTPHNAVAGRKFLWSKDNWITTFMMYTGSPTLDFANTANRPSAPSEVSKLCLTCHDGAGAVNAMANPRSLGIPAMDPTGDQLLDQWWGVEPTGFPGTEGRWGVNIGETYSSSYGTDFDAPDSGWDVARLLNDHPISFVYSDSLTDPTIKTPEGGAGASSIGGLPLSWSNDNGFAGYKVECVTCHDPHINYNTNYGGDGAYKPFLRKTLESSSLCFTCHNK